MRDKLETGMAFIGAFLLCDTLGIFGKIRYLMGIP